MQPHVQSAVPSCAIVTRGDAGRGTDTSGDFLWCMQSAAFLQVPLASRSAHVPCKGSPATCLSRDALPAPGLALSSWTACCRRAGPCSWCCQGKLRKTSMCSQLPSPELYVAGAAVSCSCQQQPDLGSCPPGVQQSWRSLISCSSAPLRQQALSACLARCSLQG